MFSIVNRILDIIEKNPKACTAVFIAFAIVLVVVIDAG